MVPLSWLSRERERSASRLPSPAFRLLAFALALALIGCSSGEDGERLDPSGQWVASAAQAVELWNQGALFLDARDRSTFLQEHILGARPIAWETLSDSTEPYRGRLNGDDEELTGILRRLGVSEDRAVVVVGQPPDGWGEDGRVAWALRALGHSTAVIVDGGHEALVDAGLDTTSGDPSSIEPTLFVIERDPLLDIDATELQELVRNDGTTNQGVVFIDTRERREYEGGTPYGESRGGHLPGAIHLHYQELLSVDGFLRSRQSMLSTLSTHGVTTDQEVIAYCTGGIRSGWLVVVMRELGFARARNYAGSMWEWSAGDPELFPLE